MDPTQALIVLSEHASSWLRREYHLKAIDLGDHVHVVGFHDPGRVRKRLGEMLIEEGLLDEEKLERALRFHRKTGLRLGEVMLLLNLLTQVELLRPLADQLGVRFMSPIELESALDPSFAKRLGAPVSYRLQLVGIRETGQLATIGMADPNDVIARDTVAHLLGKPVGIVLLSREMLAAARALVFDGDSSWFQAQAKLPASSRVQPSQPWRKSIWRVEGPNVPEAILNSLLRIRDDREGGADVTAKIS